MKNTAFDPSQVKIAKQLIFPTLQTKPGMDIFVKISEPMFEGKPLEAKPGAAQKGPATILRVLCLFAGADHPCNGSECQIVANKLLAGTLNECYPDGSYVGKSFKMVKAKTKHNAAEDGSGGYYKFDISEIDPQE